MDKLYEEVSFSINKLITQKYSTSFSIGVRCLGKEIRGDVYSLYGFVRLADEIVDTFLDQDRKALLESFEQDYKSSLMSGISINPVINAFQLTVRKYDIDKELVEAFLHSMKMDIFNRDYNDADVKKYIYGSAEVVGLICLKIFVCGDQGLYEKLAPCARRLGAAFQKTNFLRDIKNDTQNLKRVYFPILVDQPLNEETKNIILEEIYQDYLIAEVGIKQLPKCSKLGVYTAYLYYLSLTRTIENTPAGILMDKRVRVSNRNKAALLGKAYFTHKFI